MDPIISNKSREPTLRQAQIIPNVYVNSRLMWSESQPQRTLKMDERIPTTMLNVAIAIEHIVLEAVELGLGSCWIRLFDEKKIKQTLNLPVHLCVVAILPIGIPDEDPPPDLECLYLK